MWPTWAVVVAVVPIALLTLLVLRSRPLTPSAWLSAAVAGVLAGTVFGLPVAGVGIAVVRGLWTGGWILLIVLPALLVFEILDRSGALDHLSDAADQLAPTEGRRLTLLAFALPSFLQGAAGFGAPIAMSAPMLVRRGMAPVTAVAACLIGYQWAVTFGSMGSSYFMAEATARLTEPESASFALRASVLLAVTAVVSGVLVLRRGTRIAGDRWRVLVVGGAMGVTLIAVVQAQPALGSTAAGLVGLIACWWLLPGRDGTRPAGRPLLTAAMPYVVLTVSATIGFAFPPVRAVFERVPELAPVLPGSQAAFGFATTEAALSPVFRPLLHPFAYVLLAAAVGYLTYRRVGWWPLGTGRSVLTSWLTRCRKVGASILGLTVLAALLTESGMITALATALASGLGAGFVVMSAPLGTLGTVLTGSTTASNALFSSLQAEVAVALGVLPAILLSGQTAGGNVGNAITPAVAAVGTSAAGATGREPEVIKRNLGGAAALLVVITVGLFIQLALVGS